MRIVTRLSQFNFQSRVKTWAYRIAVNYILDTKKSAIERLHLNFDRFAEDLVAGLEPVSADDAEQSLLIDEVKVGCSLAMLQCLDDRISLTGAWRHRVIESGPNRKTNWRY